MEIPENTPFTYGYEGYEGLPDVQEKGELSLEPDYVPVRTEIADELIGIEESGNEAVNSVLALTAREADHAEAFGHRIDQLFTEITELKEQPVRDEVALAAKEQTHWNRSGIVSSIRIGIAEKYQASRGDLWRQSEKIDGHMAGREALADAVRLSPPGDDYESPANRQARVDTICTLSDRIVAGQPAVVGIYEEGWALYSAATPTHDGFSIAYHGKQMLNEQKFSIGVGDNPNIPFDSVWNPDVRHTEPAITVESGHEAVADYLTTECVGYMTQITDLNEELQVTPGVSPYKTGQYTDERGRMSRERGLANHNLAGAINAADAVGISLDFGDAQPHAVELLRWYVLEKGDGYGNGYDGPSLPEAQLNDLVRTGRALQAIYPPDAPQPLSDYIIAGSLKLSESIENGHILQPVIDLLHELCGIDKHEAFQRLDPFDYDAAMRDPEQYDTAYREQEWRAQEAPRQTREDPPV